MRRLIVTADDFGIAPPVNEAVERAYRDGILTTASLMVAAPATDDAIARARRLTGLHVGLHVVLVNGRPALPPEKIPDLVDRAGRFPADLFAAGVRYFVNPRARRQLEAEIREQFRFFAAAGLTLDHVNAQNHMHVHPTILSLIVRIGREYGSPAIRVPYEPFFPAWKATRSRFAARVAQSMLLAPWLALMKLRLRRHGIATNDYVLGMLDSGHVDAPRVRAYIRHAPAGVTEIYSHPSTAMWPEAEPRDADYRAEFDALVDPSVIETFRSSGVEPVAFGELSAGVA